MMMEPVHFLKIGFDAIIIVITLIFWALVHLVLPIRMSGFHCDDYSISLPYKDSTVTNGMLIVICTLLPLVLIGGTEFQRYYYQAYKQRNRYVYKIKMLKNSFINIPDVFGNIYINLGSYFFGLLVVQFLTNLAKYTIGRLRPHYLDVCKPKFISFDINETRIDCKHKEYFRYGIDYNCTDINNKRFKDAHLSFPSGHSSTVFYTMIYLIFYVRYTWKCRKFGLLIPFIQIVLFSIAFFTGLTRVVDNKHHFTDVLAGSALGTVFAILAFMLLTDLVKKTHFYSTSNDTSNNINIVENASSGSISSHSRNGSRGFVTTASGLNTVYRDDV